MVHSNDDHGCQPDVSNWHLANFATSRRDVGFWTQSGHEPTSYITNVLLIRSGPNPLRVLRRGTQPKGWFLGDVELFRSPTSSNIIEPMSFRFRMSYGCAYAARARDRALHAVLVVLVRTLAPGMSNQPDLTIAPDEALREIRDWIANRAASVDPEETDVAAELDALLDEWQRRSPDIYWNDWRPNQSLMQSAERVAMRRAIGRAPGAAWPTMNNMRSVEPSTHFRLAEALRARAGSNESGGDGK
jgi:hypothetical protein